MLMDTLLLGEIQIYFYRKENTNNKFCKKILRRHKSFVFAERGNANTLSSKCMKKKCEAPNSKEKVTVHSTSKSVVSNVLSKKNNTTSLSKKVHSSHVRLTFFSLFIDKEIK